MKNRNLALTLLFVSILTATHAVTQTLPQDPCMNSNTVPTDFTLTGSACTTLDTTTWHPTPFLDTGNCTTNCPDYGDPDHNKVSMYGVYGNNEKTLAVGSPGQLHYQKGVNLAANIVPRCKDGLTPAPGQQCFDGQKYYDPAIIFLFIGFSNLDIEIGGGASDIWGTRDHNPNLPNGHVAKNPCATKCPNLNNPNQSLPYAWNQVLPYQTGSNGAVGDDLVTQQSFLYQIYSPQTHLVGSHIVAFDGALGGQTLDRWDPYSGHYETYSDCSFTTDPNDPECNYKRVFDALNYNGYSENQVQAIFIKSTDPFPSCDLKRTYCANNLSVLPDVYQAEGFLGDILRYLKCCTLDDQGNSTGLARYPKLQQVFLTGRIYGGYANSLTNTNNKDLCLNPEPFAYEIAFAIQRLIVAQINQDAGVTNNDNYSGSVDFKDDGTGHAPWFDWGPYLWADRDQQSAGTGLFWCNGQSVSPCFSKIDVRFGDPNTIWWGDYTHPSSDGAKKVADQLVKWIQNTLPPSQGYISDWVTPWIGR